MIDRKLVKKIREIAIQRGISLTALIRESLAGVAAEKDSFDRPKQALEALERSFQELQFRVGKLTWKRADLYSRN